MSSRSRVRLYRGVHVSITRSLLIEATGSACSSNGMKIARCTRFPTRPVEMVSFVGITYSVASRHFTSTIFADQILIVGWRLSKEAWPPVGSLSATRCTNALVFFLLFLLYLSRFFSLLSSLPPLFLCSERVATHRNVVSSDVRSTRMLIASNYQTCR